MCGQGVVVRDRLLVKVEPGLRSAVPFEKMRRSGRTDSTAHVLFDDIVADVTRALHPYSTPTSSWAQCD